MVGNKNNKNNLYIKTDEDKFVKKIGKTFQNFENQIYEYIEKRLFGMKLKWEKELLIKS